MSQNTQSVDKFAEAGQPGIDELINTITEGRAEATNRLRREGRWVEASAWMERRRLQLKTELGTRGRAGDRAWIEMIHEFPPLPTEEALPTELIAGQIAEAPFDWARDVIWVYQNLKKADISAADAPSTGAVALLEFARAEPQKFLPMVAAVASKRMGPQQTTDDQSADPGLADLDRMMKAVS